MITPFLSQTNPALLGTPTITRAGEWEAHGAQDLEGIAKATKVGEAELAELAQSVPSVWGYARLFFKAWEDSEHSHHSEVIELWRRFVCLVALRKLLPPYKIKPSRIDLPSGVGGTGARSFKHAAALQWPHDILGTPLQQPVTIAAVVHEGQAIGLLLPGLMALPSRRLINPATRPSELARDFPLEQLNMPEVDRPRFYRHYLTQQHLLELNGFLKASLDTIRRWNDPALTRLSDRLTHFHNDVLLGLPQNRLPAAGNWLPTNEFEDWPLHPHSAVRLFNVELKRDQNMATAMIQLRQDVRQYPPGKMPKLVLLTRGVKDPRYRELAINDTYLIRDLIDRELSPELREQLAQKDGMLLVSEQDLFEPTLIRFASPGLYPNHGEKLKQYLLPMTPLALAIFGPRGLRDRLTVASDSDDEVKFALRVTLGLPAELEVSLERSYRRNGGEIIDARVPTSFAVWPDFSIPTAGDEEQAIPSLVYQAFDERTTGEAAKASQFLALRVFSGASLLARLLAFSKDMAVRSGPVSLRYTADEPGGVIHMLELHDMLFSPEAGEALQCGADNRAGLLLIDQRQTDKRQRAPRADPAVNCTIAIDFGTSSTTVAYLRDGTLVEPDLCPHLWLPFHETEVNAAQNNLDELQKRFAAIALIANFIPPVLSLTVPFLSILQVRNQIDPGREEPLLRGRIPFARETGAPNVTGMILEPATGTEIAVNLKWEGNEDRRELVRHFLREVMLLALGHARGLGCAPQNVSWRMSWPLAMPTETEKRFRLDAAAAFRTAIGTEPTAERLLFYPESEAIYWYLIHQQREFAAPLVVIMDVGGGTTDLAILYNGREGPHGSLRLAGRTLLVNFWVEHWKEFCDIAMTLPGTPITGADQAMIGDEERKTLVEILLNEHNHQLEDFIRAEGAGNKHPLVRATRLRVQFGFLALLYFLVHYGIASHRKTTSHDLSGGVGLFLCGNGSKLYSWFCQGGGDSQVNFERRAEAWLRQLGFVNPNLAFGVTTNAKMEVAIGGLRWQKPPAKPADDQASMASPQAARAMGFAERQEPLGPPRNPEPGSMEDFLAEIKDYFGTSVPALYEPTFLPSIRRQSETRLTHPAFFPAFVGFGGFSGPPEQDPRRRFALEITAILDKWTTVERTR